MIKNNNTLLSKDIKLIKSDQKTFITTFLFLHKPAYKIIITEGSCDTEDWSIGCWKQE